MEKILKEIDLQECPLCRGTGVLEEEGGWCFYVSCMDCGAHTAEIPYKTADDRLPQACSLTAFAFAGIATIPIEQAGPTLGQQFVHQVVTRHGLLDKEWRGESRQHRHGHNDGVDALVEHAQTGT